MMEPKMKCRALYLALALTQFWSAVWSAAYSDQETPQVAAKIEGKEALSNDESINLEGLWDSENGKVDLKVDGKTSDGRTRVTGSWKQGNKNGNITGGIFDGKTLVLDYYTPWNQKYGRWVLEKAAGSTPTFKGWNEQPLGTKCGAWNLYRPGELRAQEQSQKKLEADSQTVLIK